MSFLLFFAAFLSIANASVGNSTAAGAVDKISKANHELAGSCTAEAAANSCNDVTDGFCSKLWNKDHKGNMTIFDGKVLTGLSDKSSTAQNELLNDQALAGCLPRLDPGTRAAMKSSLDEMADVLKGEHDDNGFYSRLALAHQKVNMAADDLGLDRAEKAHPGLKQTPVDQRSPEQTLWIKQAQNGVSNEIIQAKYAQSENWKRVENIFPEVKANLMASVNKLDIPEARKKVMLERLSGVELSLPLKDPKVMASSDSEAACGSTEVNAFYDSMTHKFVVCAGLFNSLQSPAAMAFVIGHEMGHSIDAGSMAEIDWKMNSPVAKALKPLANGKAAPIKCEQWKALIKGLLAPKRSFEVKKIDPLAGLYKCLSEGADLQPLTLASVASAESQSVHASMGTNADAHTFVNLAQPDFKLYGQTIKNEFYLRPDIMTASQNGAFDPGYDREANVSEIFVQSLACQDPSQPRPAAFKAAMMETSKVLQAMGVDQDQYCGTTCEDLVGAGLAFSPRENNADWLSFGAFSAYLKKMKPADRAEASAASTSLFCDKPDSVSSAPELTELEKNWSQEPHPDDRIRRISLYTSANAALVGCAPPQKKDYGQCKP